MSQSLVNKPLESRTRRSSNWGLNVLALLSYEDVKNTTRSSMRNDIMILTHVDALADSSTMLKPRCWKALGSQTSMVSHGFGNRQSHVLLRTGPQNPSSPLFSPRFSRSRCTKSSPPCKQSRSPCNRRALGKVCGFLRANGDGLGPTKCCVFAICNYLYTVSHLSLSIYIIIYIYIHYIYNHIYTYIIYIYIYIF